MPVIRRSTIFGLLVIFLSFDVVSQCDLDSLYQHKRSANHEALYGIYDAWNSPFLDSLKVTALLTYKANQAFPLQRLSYKDEEGKGCSFFYHSDELFCLSSHEFEGHIWLCDGNIEYCTTRHIEEVPCESLKIEAAEKYILQSDSLIKEFYEFALPERN